MKALTTVFWIAVAGIGLSFGLSVYTAVANKKAENAIKENPNLAIPQPALPATR